MGLCNFTRLENPRKGGIISSLWIDERFGKTFKSSWQCKLQKELMQTIKENSTSLKGKKSDSTSLRVGKSFQFRKYTKKLKNPQSFIEEPPR